MCKVTRIQYRGGEFPAAAAALRKSLEFQSENGEAVFFQGMTQWRLGRKLEARQSQDKVVTRMGRKARSLESLRRFRAEATLLLSVRAAAVGVGQDK